MNKKRVFYIRGTTIVEAGGLQLLFFYLRTLRKAVSKATYNTKIKVKLRNNRR